MMQLKCKRISGCLTGEKQVCKGVDRRYLTRVIHINILSVIFRYEPRSEVTDHTCGLQINQVQICLSGDKHCSTESENLNPHKIVVKY